MSLTYTPGICNPVVNPISYSSGGPPPVSLLTLTPSSLAIGGASPDAITTMLAASPLGSNTGILFPDDLRTILLVSVTASTTVTSQIGTRVQGQTPPGVQTTLAAAGTYLFSPYPSQYEVQDGTTNVEVDFGTPGSVSGVIAVHIPGVI